MLRLLFAVVVCCSCLLVFWFAGVVAVVVGVVCRLVVVDGVVLSLCPWFAFGVCCRCW